MNLGKALLSAVLVSACAAVAGAEPYECTGPSEGRYESIVVPADRRCALINAEVDGDVRVSGSLKVFGKTRIGGDVEAGPDFHSVVFFGYKTRVEGSVRLRDGLAASGFFDGPRIDQNLEVSGMQGAFYLTEALVGGDLRMFRNRGGGEIVDSVIRGAFSCEDNTPQPWLQQNQVGGGIDNACLREPIVDRYGQPIEQEPVP